MSLQTFQIVNGDVVISDATGQPATLTDAQKLRQDLKCLMATAAAPDNIGAGLDDVINGDPTDEATVRALVSVRIRQAVQNMVTLAARYQRADRSALELLSRLQRLNVARVANSATDYNFQAEFISVNGAATTLSGTLNGDR